MLCTINSKHLVIVMQLGCQCMRIQARLFLICHPCVYGRDAVTIRAKNLQLCTKKPSRGEATHLLSTTVASQRACARPSTRLYAMESRARLPSSRKATLSTSTLQYSTMAITATAGTRIYTGLQVHAQSWLFPSRTLAKNGRAPPLVAHQISAQSEHGR